MTTNLLPLFPEHKAAIIANVAVAMWNVMLDSGVFGPALED